MAFSGSACKGVQKIWTLYPLLPPRLSDLVGPILRLCLHLVYASYMLCDHLRPSLSTIFRKASICSITTSILLYSRTALYLLMSMLDSHRNAACHCQEQGRVYLLLCNTGTPTLEQSELDLALRRLDGSLHLQNCFQACIQDRQTGAIYLSS